MVSTMMILQRCAEVLSRVNIALNWQTESIKGSIFPNTAVKEVALASNFVRG